MRKPAKQKLNNASMAAKDFVDDHRVVARALSWATAGVFFVGLWTVTVSAINSALWIRRRRKTAKV